MGDWIDGVKADLIRAAKSELAVAKDRYNALNAETLTTAGAAAKERFGQFCTDLETSLSRLRSIRDDMAADGCDQDALDRLDSLLAQGNTLATAKRAIYAANDFVVTLRVR